MVWEYILSYFRQCNGIPKLVDFLDCNEVYLNTPKDKLSENEVAAVDIVSAAARALWSVSKSKKNIQVMMKSGAVPLLARLLRKVINIILVLLSKKISLVFFICSIGQFIWK